MHVLVVFILVLTWGGFAHAQSLPQSVVEPYQAYEAAAQAGDDEAAADAAYRAWQAGEIERIDTQTLAILADNAANYLMRGNNFSGAIEAYQRSAELAEDNGDDPLYIAQTYRLMANAQMREGEYNDAIRSSRQTVRLVEGLSTQEAAVERINANGTIAVAYWQRGNFRRGGRFAEDAINEKRALGFALGISDGLLAFYAGADHAYSDRPEEASFWFSITTILLDDSDEHSRLKKAASAWRRLLLDELTSGERRDLISRLHDQGYLSVSNDLAATSELGFEPAHPEGYVLPRAVRRSVHYPTNALQARIDGMALIEHTIETDGSVSDVELIYSVPYSDFGDAALRGVRRWVYAPATLDGVPVRHEGLISRVDFEMAN